MWHSLKWLSCSEPCDCSLKLWGIVYTPNGFHKMAYVDICYSMDNPFDNHGCNSVVRTRELFRRSKMDWLVPPVFAAIVVSTCAYAVKAMGLWEDDNDNDDQP
ncbi:hypothetical protein Leryth_003470 [Lithospermum erythrorhizon]|nr:hypothetical protein Leryth_003470 [Lithospermum erythrorhizon]